MKNRLKKEFKKVYGSKARLCAVQFDGFSHKVFFDYGKNTHLQIERYTACAPELNKHDKARDLLGSYPHHIYQNNAKEYVFIDPTQR